MRKTIAILTAVPAVALAALSTPAIGSSTKTVRIGDNFFAPTHLTVSHSARVHWHWTGVAPHNVTVSNGPTRFHSRTQTHGDYAFTFRKRGTYHLFCTIHGFKMVVAVK